ncbi:MAG: YihY/virulence factor BrkB family protein [Desulfobacteraceae bacterium]|nr:YihY/virulence factor BrkB family protein [Desulfobacteraceae bacterium]
MAEEKRLTRAAFREWLYRKPAAGEGAASRFLRAACRIALVYWHEFWRDAILLRASALTFTVVLSLVPVLALSTAVLKGLGAGNQMRQAAYQFIDTFTAETAAPGPAPSEQQAAPATRAARERTAQTFANHLRQAVDAIFNYVERTNFATLGIVGLIGLFVTVVSVLGAIEDAMNTIWSARAGRPLGRRIMDYLALMLLLPLGVNVGMAAVAIFESKRASHLIERFFPVAWAAPLVVHVLTICVLAAIFTTFYQFLPNTRVSFRPALIGGIVGALAWMVVQVAYIGLQVGVARYNAIYGSFATLPLFFLWVYNSWVVFLSGAEVAFAAQVWPHYAPHQEVTPGRRLALAYDLLAAVYDDFRRRQATDPAALPYRLGYTDAEVRQAARDLRAAGYLRETADTGGLLPAAGADRVQAAELIDAVWGRVDRDTPGGRLAAHVLAGAKSSLAGRSLQELSHGDRPE